ncbi:membrane protein insertion efficiency factor YidD [Planctomicrobium piriforme]|uniref:membrane protein insertion efficiency factor YidD n=1 Tax=Planctomicrobium piriforme TaxID=1576369 RepID=UPI001FEB00C0|nr:membrane protein insertion efficiency factor YidD [Planctomicrobium piriforme]
MAATDEHPTFSDLNPAEIPRVSLFKRAVRAVSQAISAGLIGLVYLYRVTAGPFLGGRCRFEPSCSEYFIQAVKKYGPVRGAVKGIWRILRCHPFCEGGVDPP